MTEVETNNNKDRRARGSFTMTPEVFEKLREHCKEKNTKLSNVIEQALVEYLSK